MRYRQKIRHIFQKNRLLNMIPRVITATSYFNYKYWQIIKWLFNSKEDTNFTFDLTQKNKLYMAQAISYITKTDVTEILNYFAELEQDTQLKTHIKNKTKSSEWKNCADLNVFYGRRLIWYAFVRLNKPKIIVETGIDKGLGSVILCSALLKNKKEGHEGFYYGTDINKEAGYLLDEPYSNIGKILYGDSIKSLTKLNKKINLFINDSDHSEKYEAEEYETITDKLTKKSIIIGDNSNATSVLAEYSLKQKRNFIYISEEPKKHWYPGGGTGVSFN